MVTTADALGERRFAVEQPLKAGGAGRPVGYLAGFAGLMTLLGGVCGGLIMMVSAVGSPEVEPAVGVLFLLVLGGLGVVVGGAMLGGAWWLLKKPRPEAGVLQLDICDGGVRLARRAPSGETIRQATWLDLTGFRSSPPFGRIYGKKVNAGYHFFALEVGDLAISVSRQPQLKAMGDFIEERLLAAQLPAALADFKAGETVHFGDVSVGPDGVVLKGLVSHRMVWDELRGLGLGRMARITAGTVRGPLYIETPNAPVLFALVHVLVQRRLS